MFSWWCLEITAAGVAAADGFFGVGVGALR